MSDQHQHPSETAHSAPSPNGSDESMVNPSGNAAKESPAPEENTPHSIPEAEERQTPKMVSMAELDAVQAQAKQYMDGWQRERAEFANFKRRTERERADTYQNASADVIKALLPVIDDLERALANVPADLTGNSWVSGVEMINKKLERVLENFNVTAVDPVGKAFDPVLHEAISMDESDTVESGHVIETLQRGYLVGDRVLRPALVRIAR